MSIRLKRAFTLVIVACGLLLPQSALLAATLHGFVVAATHESDIGPSVERDYSAISKELGRIADYTGLSLKVQVFSGRDFQAAKVLEKVKALQVQSNDIIVFYYSGHGYRNASKEDPWPVMFFDWKKGNLDLYLIAEVIHDKQAQFALVMADCCNNIMSDSTAPDYLSKALLVDLSPDYTEENYRFLFLESTGTLLVSSSEPGEVSWAKPSGSVFTKNFLKVLRDQTKKHSSVTWEGIFDKTAQKINDLQHPQYQFYD